MALSPNYGWAEPDNSSLVKNGAQDIRALGDAIDTSVWNIGFGQAGKNKLINGDLRFWQRGTSYSAAGYGIYGGMDRFKVSSIGGTSTVSQQTFTPATAPVAGYEGTYYCRIVTAASSMTYYDFGQAIEDVRTFAGQTMTVSFWAKANVATTVVVNVRQDFGSGGSSAVNNITANFALTTSWVRYTKTVAVPSISGKTIGTSSNLGIYLQYDSGTINSLTVETWGWQAEYGSIATPFQTATGTLQGELAACQRYLPAFSGSGLGGNLFNVLGWAYSTTNAQFNIPLLVTPRVRPTGMTISALSDFSVANQGFSSAAPTAISFNSGGQIVQVNTTTTAGSPTLVTGQIANLSLSGANGTLLFTGCEL
jgi:hypothetical protein